MFVKYESKYKQKQTEKKGKITQQEGNVYKLRG
jgi:hypothetical protein